MSNDSEDVISSSQGTTTIIDKRSSGGNGTKVTAVLSVVVAALLGVWGIISNYIEPLEQRLENMSNTVIALEKRLSDDDEQEKLDAASFSAIVLNITHLESKQVDMMDHIVKVEDISLGNRTGIAGMKEQLRALERHVYNGNGSLSCPPNTGITTTKGH